MNSVKVENHFARNDEDHVDLGKTTSGVPIKIDRRFVNADLKIVTGLVEPHLMAGYSGGRKVITPGIAHTETITSFHTARFLENPRAANCMLDGNPLHDVQLEVIKKLPETVAVNTVIDEKRRLSFINFGEIIKSHIKAIEYLKRYSVISVNKKFSTIVTSAGGYPLDKTYYQTIKGMVGAMEILKPGGNLVIVSECSEGMGSSEFVDAQKRLSDLGPEKFLHSLKKKQFAAVDEWQTEMQLKPMRIGSIHLFSSGLTDEEWAMAGVLRVRNLTEKMQILMDGSGDKDIAIIPEGPYVIPVHNG